MSTDYIPCVIEEISEDDYERALNEHPRMYHEGSKFVSSCNPGMTTDDDQSIGNCYWRKLDSDHKVRFFRSNMAIELFTKLPLSVLNSQIV